MPNINDAMAHLAIAHALAMDNPEVQEEIDNAISHLMSADNSRLPCDVQVGGGVFRAGVPTRFVIDAIERKRNEAKVPEDTIAAMRDAARKNGA